MAGGYVFDGVYGGGLHGSVGTAAVDEDGNAYELSPDPMNEELQEMLKGLEIGKPETFRDHMKPVLSNSRIFGSDLYEAGIGELIEDMFREEISGFGGIRRTIRHYLG
jgi:fructuronate reductase